MSCRILLTFDCLPNSRHLWLTFGKWIFIDIISMWEDSFFARWFLDTLKFSKTSKVFVGNGVLMTLVFFFVRILAMPFYWWKVYTVAITPLWSHMGHFRFVLISVCLVLDVINLYWFSKMMRGVLKILTGVQRKKLGWSFGCFVLFSINRC